MIARLARETRGVSAVEFAFVLPFLVLLFVGGYQLSDAISAYRKVTVATKTVADLTSQYTSVTNGELDQILAASQQVMAPYKVSNAKITVSQVSIDNNGNAMISWSRALNTPEMTVGTAFTVPATIKQNNTSLIVATITYSYVPVVASGMFGTIPMRDDIIMSPRASSSVKKIS
ncbi:pilus assembly protein [Sphingomonas gei]|uniref:Pilus assembly protein n=1 Tax=Sphingomonas gei TaxID=1395960 RepID=A0A4S1XHG7_9SPHN|nr:TadE/TadG family type IV pilus assembly protein [Sphingomonas gei]TGX56099.1 pilus assembly protein [Sphingomonas gei]